MDYVITTSTGGAYLLHSGVKGMKWGVWNAETKKRYSSGRGHRSITRADKKVDKRAAQYSKAVSKKGEDSKRAKTKLKRLNTAVEKREFRVEKNHPGEGKISPDRYNALRSNERVRRSAITGYVTGGVLGTVVMGAVSSRSSAKGRRAVMDVVRGRETYRANKKTGIYENTNLR